VQSPRRPAQFSLLLLCLRWLDQSSGKQQFAFFDSVWMVELKEPCGDASSSRQWFDAAVNDAKVLGPTIPARVKQWDDATRGWVK